MNDAELLRRYAEQASEPAFAEFVQRHIDMVYATALRHVGGNSHAARDAAVRSDRLLAVAAHPDIVFTSDRLAIEAGSWTLHGSLSVRGVARPVVLRVEGAVTTGNRLRLRASARIDRYEFGVTKARGLAARHLDLTLDIVADRS